MTFITPRRVFAGLAVGCVGMLAFGLYLQNIKGLEPCPMCVVQRYLFVLIALTAGMAGALARNTFKVRLFAVVLIGWSLAGAFVAARQSWLQWYPPVVASCGRDFYGMIEGFPLSRAIPMIFRGSGDCSVVDWTFLGGSIANWAFVVFVGIAGVAVALIRASRRG
jgi:disulfide bond formation protein DsbB